MKIVDSIYELAKLKNVDLSQEDIENTLRKSITSRDIDFDDFANNFNTMLIELKINISDLAKSIGYDTSFLSKIKTKSRKPSDLDNFTQQVADYIVQKYKNENKKKVIVSLLNCSLSDLENNDNYKSLFIKWLSTPKNDNTELVKNFLSKLDAFDLNDYIGTDFNKIKVPTSPVILRNSKTFYGIEGRKKAENEFLKTTLISKSNESIFFYSNLPMTEASQDDNFKKNWVLAMTMLLKKGLHLNMIHDIDRPLNEMLLGLENWIPIYMTGSISPYYLKEPPSNLFTGSHCTSGSIALSSECMKNNEKYGRFYVTTKKEELEYYKEKSNYLLSKAKPLITIFKESDKLKFEEFINTVDNSTIKKAQKSIFKNIDFCINENKWVMINKKTAPEIHFVIYNSKLRTAIETFLNEKD